jgi:hypothetical protein
VNKKKTITSIGRAQRPLVPGMALAFAAAGVTLPIDAPAATHLILNCNDSGFGSLRDAIGAVTTLSGDTIDLSQPLPCSSITLTTGAIFVSQNDLTLIGPGADTLAIDGGGVDRVIAQVGAGTLAINYLTITHGKYHGDGGCIFAYGNIALVNSRVSDCAAKAQGTANAYGGGILTNNLSMIGSTVSHNAVSAQGTYKACGGGVFTVGGLSMIGSTISDNLATSISGTALGGGAYVYGNFSADLSTISNNNAIFGGGLRTEGNAGITQSTISGNRAVFDAAWNAKAGSHASGDRIIITNSTISGNVASGAVGGVDTYLPLTLTNSTIAFNQTDNQYYSAGLFSEEYATLTLESSIIADNTITSTGAPSDLGGLPGTLISGHNNLITSGVGVMFPPGTITACPKLGPLADNGGPTLTHALLSTSRAIDNGNNSAGNFDDQRGTGYPRPFGSAADIGAYEWQGTPEDRIFNSGFEVACDH